CAPFVEVVSVGAELDFSLTPQSLALAIAAGVDTDTLRGRLGPLAPLPGPVERMLNPVGAVGGRAEFVASEGCLWGDDPEIQRLLRTRGQTADLFVDPSPPGGLLVTAGVDLDRLARRCRSLGVELLVGGEPYRTRSMTSPSRSSSGSLQAARR